MADKKKAAPAKAPQAPKAPAKAPVSKGEANGFRVGDTGVKVWGMVYAAGSVIPKELVTEEITPYLVWEANVEDTPADTDTLETDEQKAHREEIQGLEGGEAPKTDGSEGTNLGAESNGSAPNGAEAGETPNADGSLPSQTLPQGDAQTGGTL